MVAKMSAVAAKLDLVKLPTELHSVRNAAVEEYVRARIHQFVLILLPKIQALFPTASMELLDKTVSESLEALPAPLEDGSAPLTEDKELQLVFRHDCLRRKNNEAARRVRERRAAEQQQMKAQLSELQKAHSMLTERLKQAQVEQQKMHKQLMEVSHEQELLRLDNLAHAQALKIKLAAGGQLPKMGNTAAALSQLPASAGLPSPSLLSALGASKPALHPNKSWDANQGQLPAGPSLDTLSSLFAHSSGSMPSGSHDDPMVQGLQDNTLNGSAPMDTTPWNTVSSLRTAAA